MTKTTEEIVEAFPYAEAFEGGRKSMLGAVQRLAPGATFPPAKIWHGLMRRVVEGAFNGGDPTSLVVDANHGRGTFLNRTQAYVGSLAVRLFVAEYLEAEAA